MNKFIKFATLSVIAIKLSAAPTWQSILEGPLMSGSSATEIKQVAYTHAILISWFEDQNAMDRKEATSLAFDLLGSRPYSEILDLRNLIETLRNELRIQKEIEARRDLASQTLVLKKDPARAVSLLKDFDSIDKLLESRKNITENK